MPDNPARPHTSPVARYRRWVQRLTLRQYALFVAVISFVVATVVDAALSAITEPFSWVGVAVWTVLMTAFLTWWQRDYLQQAKEYPADRDDNLTGS